jgi:hypothetical protein
LNETEETEDRVIMIGASKRSSLARTWRGHGVAALIAASLGSLGVVGCGSEKTQSGGPATGFAVVGSDFTSTVVSLLNADGTLAQDDCIDSGTKAGGNLSLTLSGDVSLPSQPQQGGKLWLVDRGNAALTVLAPETCEVTRQISVTTGFKSNPHDVAVLSQSKAYVTRYEKNVTPTDANSAGDDVLIIDPTGGVVTGRIDLSSYAAPVAGATIQARPDRMLIAAGQVFVTLASQDAGFKATGEGRVVVIDPATDAVTSTIALPGLKGCSALSYVDGSNEILVACGGSFADADKQADGSGVATIDLSAAPPAVHVTKASALGGPPVQPVNFSWVVALSSTRAFTSTLGTFPAGSSPGTNDAALAFDPTTGASTPITLEAAAGDLGRGALSGTKLLIPDADFAKPRIHVFDASGTGAPAETATVDPDPGKGMPPRELAWY